MLSFVMITEQIHQQKQKPSGKKIAVSGGRDKERERTRRRCTGGEIIIMSYKEDPTPVGQMKTALFYQKLSKVNFHGMTYVKN